MDMYSLKEKDEVLFSIKPDKGFWIIDTKDARLYAILKEIESDGNTEMEPFTSDRRNVKITKAGAKLIADGGYQANFQKIQTANQEQEEERLERQALTKSKTKDLQGQERDRKTTRWKWLVETAIGVAIALAAWLAFCRKS